MRFFAALAASAVLFQSAAATKWLPTRTIDVQPRTNTNTNTNSDSSSPFVTIENGQFMQRGKPFKFVAADAYWLQGLSDENINITMKSLASKNFTVVRTWAFNDVTQIPDSGPWIQMLSPNGTRTFNNGTSGAQRLRSILSAAEANDIMVQFVLTNNWSASNISNITITLQNGTQIVNPRGSYSNDYGGADRYVQFNNGTDHGQFFTRNDVIGTFVDGLTDLIPQFASHESLISWELANDPRCNGTLQDPAIAAQCNTTSVTLWHSTVSQQVKKLDPNHLVSSGSGGFLCQTSNCPKSFFKPAPGPVASPSPGLRRRSLTEKSIISERNARWKRTAEAAKQQQDTAEEKRARGTYARWIPRSLLGREAAANAEASAPRHTRRQVMTVGSAMDGSFGADSLDIAAINDIAFTTFQLFPDQNVYEPADPNLPAINNTLIAGLQWIRTQASVSRMVMKPSVLTGFGLVDQTNAPFFIPFNDTSLTFPNSSTIPRTLSGPQVGILQGQAPVNESDQALAYETWLEAAISNGINGITVHQWGQGNLQPAPPPPVPTQGISPASEGTFSPALPAVQNTSPSDGYQAISPQIQAVLQSAAVNVNLINSISIPQV